jgi:hypothetical protein
MDLTLQQRGLFLGRPAAPYEQQVPWKYCVVAHAEASVARDAVSPHLTPRPQDPGC